MTEGNNHYTSNWSQQTPSQTSRYSIFGHNQRPRLSTGLPSPSTARSSTRLTLGRAHEQSAQILRNNISQVINELGPIMNQSRIGTNTGGLSLGSWLQRTHHPPDLEGTPSSVTEQPNNSFVINVDDVPPSSTTQPTAQPSDHSQDSNTQHNTNDNTTNNNTDNNEEGSVDALRQTPVAQTVFIIQKYIPFVIILLTKSLYDHRAGILIFIGLLAAFVHANTIVKLEISRKGNRSLLSLLLLFFNLLVCVCLIYYVFRDQKLYKSLVFIPPYTQPLTWWDLLWIVGVTDFVLKLITIQLKIVMTCLPNWVLPYTSRGKWYLLIESLSQLYRGLTPIQPWLYYLLESYQGAEKVVGVFMSAAYMVSKGNDLMHKVKLVQSAVWKMLQNVTLGVSPSKEQLISAGTQCPICHDEYDTPVLLHCRHVFCEGCVTTWFDREQTCPLCRAKVVDDPSWRDGATTMFIQLF